MHPIQGSTPSLTTSSARTQNKWKLCVWVCPGTTSIPVYRPKLKNSNFGYVGFQEEHTQTNQNWAHFRKLNSPPTKLGMLFPAYLQAR